MNFCDLDSEVGNLRATEEHILSSFTQRLIEIASAAGARGSATSPTAALNAMGLPAIALDRYGSVVDANAAAEVNFDDNIRIKNRRLFVRDPDSRTLLKEAIDQLARPPIPNALAGEPVVVPRMDKLPVIVRIWPFEGPSHPPAQEVRALLTLNALGPRPRAASGDPRQGIPPDAVGSKARVHHRERRSSQYCRPRAEDFPGNGAQSVEIRLCQDGHPPTKRTRRTANASRVTDLR